jgi:hypothetical protein
MSRLLLIFILIFSFQSLTKADDISDYQIEGMSIGDSALNFFSKERIDKRKQKGFIYPSKVFYSATIYDEPKFELYNHVQFHIKTADKKYIIESIGGQIEFKNDINNCYIELEKISLQFKNEYDYIDYIDTGILEHTDGVSGNVRSIYITLKSKDEIVIECYDYNKATEKNGQVDHLLIALDSKDFAYWLHNKAYK